MSSVPEANQDINGKHNAWATGVKCTGYGCEAQFYVWAETFEAYKGKAGVNYRYLCKECGEAGPWSALGATRRKR